MSKVFMTDWHCSNQSMWDPFSFRSVTKRASFSGMRAFFIYKALSRVTCKVFTDRPGPWSIQLNIGKHPVKQTDRGRGQG